MLALLRRPRRPLEGRSWCAAAVLRLLDVRLALSTISQLAEACEPAVAQDGGEGRQAKQNSTNFTVTDMRLP